jgi:hypothetical protein
MAEPWYSSGTFWSIAAVAVGLIAIIVGAWAAFRSANPHRNLYIFIDSSIALLWTPRGLDGGVEVRIGGRTLTAPHVVTIEIISRSARDIPKTAFDDAPLTLNLGVPVVAILEQRSKARTGLSEPAVVATARGLAIGPALLARNHKLRYTVLVEGRPTLTPQGNLTDVHIHMKPPPWFPNPNIEVSPQF